MKHTHTMMATVLALAGAVVAMPANAESGFSPYIGLAAELWPDVDPREYEGPAQQFNEKRSDAVAVGAHAGIRYGRVGLEGGWMLEKTVRWTKTVQDENRRQRRHEAEVTRGGPYAAVTFDVVSGPSAHVYIKGGLSQGERWAARVDGETEASGRSGAVATAAGGLRYEVTDSGLEIRVEVEMRHDPDIGTKVGARVGTGWRF